MNAVEKLLNEGLQRDPADWSIRMELATKLAESGSEDECLEVLTGAPVPVPGETELQKALDLIGGPLAEARPLIEPFVQEEPSSSIAHLSLARSLAAAGELERAQKHYKTAAALDPKSADAELEALFKAPETEEPAEPEPEPEPVAVAEPVVEPIADVVPVTEVRPLSPPPGKTPEEKTPEEKATVEKTDEPAVELAVKETAPGNDAAVAALASEFDDEDGEPALIAIAEDDGEYHEHHEGERAFIVGEGELAHVHEKDPDTATKISALTMAILVHVGIIALFALVVISMPRPNPPQLVATSIPSLDNNELDQQKIERIQRRPSESAAAQMEIVSTVAASPVAMPEMQTNNLTFDPIGVGDSFGVSMNFTDEDGAGMVSFFGSKSKAQKVLFVVDASASMKSKGSKGKHKFTLMKEELIRSIEALPPSVEFQIIFFSGPAWFVGDKEDRKDWHALVKNGKKLNFWHYKDGDPKDLPAGKYIDASKSKIRRTKKHIEEVKMSLGTDWRAPLEMAVNMKPDVIYFMTDGAVGKHPDKPNVVEHLVKYNKDMSNAKINTICLMQLNAFDDLKALADKTKGEFTLVLEDGTTVRGRDVEKMAKKKK